MTLPENVSVSSAGAPTPRATFQVAMVAAVLLALLAAAGLVFLPASIARWVVSLAAGTSALLAVLAAALQRRAHNQAAGAVLVVAVLLLIAAVDASFKGLGVPLAIACLTIGGGIALAAFPVKRTGLVMAVVYIAGVVVLLADLYGATTRQPVAVNLTIQALTVIMLLTFAVLLARNLGWLSVRTKVTIAFVSMATIALSVMGYLNYRSAREILITQLNQSLLGSARQTAASLDDFIATNLNAIQTEARLPTFVEYLSQPTNQRKDSKLEADLMAAMYTLSRKDPAYISSYALLDADGVVVADTLAMDLGMDKSIRNYFQEAVRTGLPYVSPVQASPTLSGFWGWYFSAPVRGSNSEIIGVLRVRYNAAILQNFVTQPGLLSGEESYAVLVDENYVRLAHGAKPSLFLKSYAPLDSTLVSNLQAAGRLPPGTAKGLATDLPEVVAALERIDEQPFFTSQAAALGGEPAVTAAARLKRMPWIVLTRQSQGAALAPIEARTRTTFLVGVLVATLAALAAYLMARVLSAPIMNLIASAEQIAAGELQTEIQVKSQDEIGALATAFRKMTSQLVELIGSLERRVEERTRAIETSAEVSRRLSTILDQGQLVKEVVEQLKSAFHYYHAHIYLFDENGENLVMVGGTGEAGQTMLARGHKLPAGIGLVGRAALSNAPVLVADTSQDPQWLPNPLLPETRSELAVPIAIGGEVLGVLDIQQSVVDGFDEDDARLIQSIANQVAIAVQNARAYTVAQRQAEREALIRSISEKIQSASTIEDVMSASLSELAQALSARRASVHIGRPARATTWLGGNGRPAEES